MKFSLAVIFFQLLLIVLFVTLVEYDADQSGAIKKIAGNSTTDVPGMASSYPMFQDVHVMIFVGFGLLMTFLKRYGYSSVGYNFFISAIAIQWYTIIAGCIEHRGSTGFTIKLNIKSLITADCAAAAVLITFGVVLGKVNRLQLLVICIIETVMFAVNEFILLEKLKITDAGGSLVIHCFGCYFGMALSFMLRNQDNVNHPNEGSCYHSDLFAMIGTLFLWTYWPSFNSVLVPAGKDQQRTVINTYFSLVACCVTTFALSGLMNRERRLSMVHVQNATLAGGVAIGTVANMIIKPWGAMLIGSLAGIISVLGYTYLTPFLNRILGLHDTCGVNNLHGLPAVLAGIAGTIAARLANDGNYHGSLKSVFDIDVSKSLPRSPRTQALYQLAAIAVTLGVAMASGAITGLILKLNVFDPPRRHQLFDDQSYWEVNPLNEANEEPGEIKLLNLPEPEQAV